MEDIERIRAKIQRLERESYKLQRDLKADKRKKDYYIHAVHQMISYKIKRIKELENDLFIILKSKL